VTRSLCKVHVSAPTRPGGPAITVAEFATVDEARAYAVDRFGHRRDLARQDVRIELPSGHCIEYAGPAR